MRGVPGVVSRLFLVLVTASIASLAIRHDILDFCFARVVSL